MQRVAGISGKSRYGFRRSQRAVAGLVCAGLIALLPGCFAQQSDLVRVSKDLDKKISKLDQRENEIDGAVKQANEQIAQQKKDIDQLIHETRARLLAEIRELREEDLPKFQGKLDENLYQVNKLAGSVDDRASKLEEAMAKREAVSDKRFATMEKTLAEQHAAKKDETSKLNAALASMAKTVDGRLEEHDKAIAVAEGQNKAVKDQLGQLHRALGDFKQALAGLGDKLGDKLAQQEQRTNDLAAKHDADAKATAAKLAATTDHLDKVTKSVNSVAKTLEAVSTKLLAQQDVQERRIEETAHSTAQSLRALTTQFNALAQNVNTLTQSVHTLTQNATKSASRTTKGKAEGKLLRPADGSPEARHEPPAQPVVSESAPAEPGVVAVPQEPATAPAEPTPQETSEAAPAPAETSTEEKPESPRHAYDRSMQKFKQRDLEGALDGFADFLARHPKSELAGNAQFWIGECYYGKGEYDRAIEAYDRVKKAYPTSEKIPAALLKKGLAYLALRDRRKASSALTQVVEAFPASPEAGKARDKLGQLKQGQ